MVTDFFKAFFVVCVMHFPSTKSILFCFSNNLIKKIDQNESKNQNRIGFDIKNCIIQTHK